MTKKIEIQKLEIIKNEPEVIKNNNAFILPNGEFVLAKGFSGMNPSHQLESSSLLISRNLYDHDLTKEYQKYISENPNRKKLYYLRSMLVHYFGFALFARRRNGADDESLVANPKYYGKVPTPEQLETLLAFFELNEDTLYEKYDITEEYMKVLSYKQHPDNWHKEL